MPWWWTCLGGVGGGPWWRGAIAVLGDSEKRGLVDAMAVELFE